MNRRRAAIALMIATLLFTAAARASTADEIRHLLRYVGESDCTFVRNGVEADAKAAEEHIRTKYAYVKGWVDSAEDFIRLAASQSSMSGKPYLVRCGSSEFRSADWLTAELHRYRQHATH